MTTASPRARAFGIEDTGLDPIYDVTVFAERLGVSPSTIYRMRAKGEDLPPAFKVGSQLRWRASTVEAWIRDRETAVA